MGTEETDGFMTSESLWDDCQWSDTRNFSSFNIGLEHGLTHGLTLGYIILYIYILYIYIYSFQRLLGKVGTRHSFPNFFSESKHHSESSFGANPARVVSRAKMFDEM